MFEYQSGDDYSGSAFLTEPGTYHLWVAEVEETPTNHEGRPVENAAFRLVCSVLAGTTSGQEDKEVALTWFLPKPSAKDGGAFQRKKIDRVLLALGLIDESAKGKQVKIDLLAAKGRHFVAKLEQREYNGKTFLDVAFTDTFHVDSSEAKPYPKGAKAMALPGKWRRTAAPAAPAAPAAAPLGAAASGNGQTAAPWESSL